ncbi:unnamed protein product [Brachionus calyciflorus]|uniref:Uncharacterized protein n=1 Tax=Brachionus calyciflorus TaxID=104777 RepID=A0A813M5H9_9BILA|nr:unnamed protein product [Brachionus calyciflorus]
MKQKITQFFKILFFIFFINSVSIYCASNRKKETAPRIISLKPGAVTILAKNDIIFECHVLGYPLAQISWRKNNKKLSEHNKKFRIIHGTNVSFLRVTDASYVQNNNKLNITCLAENIIGQDEQNSVLTILSERDRPKKIPFITITHPKSVEPDTLFKIDCNVTHFANNIQWYQSNRPISFDNDKYFSNFSWVDDATTRHTLFVKGLSLSSDPYVDSIEIDFLCSATNSYGTYSAETSIMLRNRLMPPNFVLPKRSTIELEYGTSINLTCNANGMPRPRVKWLEGNLNQILDLSDSNDINANKVYSDRINRVNIVSANSRNLPINVDILQLHNLTQTKNFTCQAQNTFARPEIPIGPNVTNIYLNSIEIEWKPGGLSEVLHYLIKYKKIDMDRDTDNVDTSNRDSEDFDIDDDNEEYTTLNTSNTKMKIGNSLKPYTLYEIRVISVNHLGKSAPSKALVVRTAAAKPGNVKNIRYTFHNDNSFLIKCDEPDDPNGDLKYFKIYHTDQVTNPLRNWNLIQVMVKDMPHLLNIDRRRNSAEFSSYYLRISAVNLELGEGPFSNIVELKRFDKKFEAPYNFETLLINSTYALVKWNLNLEMLKSIYRQYNNLNYNSHQSDVYRALEESEIMKNLNFEMYLKNSKKRKFLKSFRTLSGLELFQKIGFKRLITKKEKRHAQNFLTNFLPFEYNITDLTPKTTYSFEIAARLYNLESQLSQILQFTTPEGQYQNADKCK